MRIIPIKILVVDGSPGFRASLSRAMDADGGLQVVGTVGSAAEAEQAVRKLQPDAVVLEASAQTSRTAGDIGRIDPSGNLFFLVVGSQPQQFPPSLRKGKIDFARKPVSQNRDDFSAFCNEVFVKIKISARPVSQKNVGSAESSEEKGTRIIAIGASTGGTEATAEIIRNLPGGLPGIIIVQHMPAGFTRMYAERLDSISKLHVSEAKDGDRVLSGSALVAPGGKHMILKKDSMGYYVKCVEGERVNGHCPSVGVLFESVAAVAGRGAVGVILTGMGKDGAEGLLKMKAAGAFTIGQDEASSVVYGMPMVAYEIGAVTRQVPLKEIAGILIKQFH